MSAAAVPSFGSLVSVDARPKRNFTIWTKRDEMTDTDFNLFCHHEDCKKTIHLSASSAEEARIRARRHGAEHQTATPNAARYVIEVSGE